MPLILAALGAMAAAVVEATLAGSLQVWGAHPHPTLVFVVLWGTVGGLDGALSAAFVGGITLDALLARPLGSTAFALLVAAGIGAAFGQLFARLPLVAPPVAAGVASLVHSLLLLAAYGALRAPVAVGDPLGRALPAAVYDLAVAAVLAPLALIIRSRGSRSERADW
jgi:rod shape-determining protein MreD